MSNGASNILPSTSASSISTTQPVTLSKPNSRKAHPTFHFVAGLASGISSAVLLQPADLLKTRVQQSRSSSLLPVLRTILSSPHPIHNLWRGTVPSALRTGFGSALYFTSLNTLRQFVANNAVKTSVGHSIVVDNDTKVRAKAGASSSVLPKLSATGNLITGATARVLAGFVLMPVTVIKVRYESDLYAYKSLTSASSSIYKTEGVRGFFSGFGATAVRDAPYAGLYVVFYEGCKTYLSRLVSANSEGAATSSAAATVNATSGVIAAGVATAVTNPFDAVKTRLQLMPQKYQNMLKATSTMFREEGFKSFFDGLGLRMGRKAVSSALVWTVYEELISRAERSFFHDEKKSNSAATL